MVCSDSPRNSASTGIQETSNAWKGAEIGPLPGYNSRGLPELVHQGNLENPSKKLTKNPPGNVFPTPSKHYPKGFPVWASPPFGLCVEGFGKGWPGGFLECFPGIPRKPDLGGPDVVTPPSFLGGCSKYDAVRGGSDLQGDSARGELAAASGALDRGRQ